MRPTRFSEIFSQTGSSRLERQAGTGDASLNHSKKFYGFGISSPILSYVPHHNSP